MKSSIGKYFILLFLGFVLTLLTMFELFINITILSKEGDFIDHFFGVVLISAVVSLIVFFKIVDYEKGRRF